MSAELAILNKLAIKPSATSNITITAAENIVKYSDVYIDSNGQAVNSVIDIKPDAIYSTTENALTVIDEAATSSGYYTRRTSNINSPVWDLGGGSYVKPYWYKSAGGWYIKIAVETINTTTGARDITAVSGTFATAIAGTSISYPYAQDYGTSIIFLGGKFVVTCAYYDGTSYYSEVFEIAYDTVNKAFSTPTLMWSGTAGASTNTYSNGVIYYSETHYIYNTYDGTNYVIGIKALGTTAVGTYAGTTIIAGTMASTIYNYKTFYSNNTLFMLYSNTIYYVPIDPTTYAFSTEAYVTTTVDSQTEASLNGNGYYMKHTDIDANGNFYACFAVYGNLTTYGFNWDGALLTEIAGSRVNNKVAYSELSANINYGGYRNGSNFTVTANSEWLISSVLPYVYSQSSEASNSFTISVFNLVFNGSSFNITNSAIIDNRSSGSTYVSHYVYSDANGVFLMNAESQLNDGDVNTFCCRVDKISLAGTTGTIKYSKRVNATALEDVLAGASGTFLAKSPVIVDNTAVAGSIVLNKYMTTSTGLLVEMA